jgi:hypothetical protein
MPWFSRAQSCPWLTLGPAAPALPRPRAGSEIAHPRDEAAADRGGYREAAGAFAEVLNRSESKEKAAMLAAL